MRSVKHGGRIGHATSDDTGSGGSCNSRTRCPRGRVRWKQQEGLEHDDAVTTATTTTPAVDSKVAREVPAATKSKGTLIVAADAHYAPDEFIGADRRTVDAQSRSAEGQRRRPTPPRRARNARRLARRASKSSSTETRPQRASASRAVGGRSAWRTTRSPPSSW